MIFCKNYFVNVINYTYSVFNIQCDYFGMDEN